MTHTTDILICGGGAPGLTLAVLLAGIGVEVAVIERGDFSTPHSDAGRTAALMQGSVNILRQAGVWNGIEAATNPLRTLRIVDDTGSAPVVADFTAREIGLEAFAHNTPNHVLTTALAARAAHMRGLTLLPRTAFRAFGAPAEGFAEALTDGPAIRARLCVAADGRASAVRQAARIDSVAYDYGQHAVTCLIGHSLPHDDISTEFHRDGGPFTLVPLPGRRSSVVWVDASARAERHMKLKKKDFERALQERSDNALGRIELVSSPAFYPLSGLRATNLTAPRVVLIAEAAHVLHPLGAQGLNLSLRDAGLLAEIIADVMRLGGDPGGAGVLARYEAARRQDIALRSRGADGLNMLVRNENGFLQMVRRTGLKTVSGLNPLKQFAMREGLAPGQDSRLARGEAL